MSAIDRLHERLSRGDTIDVRGDGKAGGGLVLAVQAFGAALSQTPGLDVQDWPLFSSARKGANVRAFLRVARGEIQATCQITAPDIALLMNEAAAEEIDFAEGTAGAVYVINTARSPEEAARRFHLNGRGGGTVATVSGDALGVTHLGRPLGNIAVLAAMVRATGLVEPGVARESLEHNLQKRRLPERIVAANLTLFDAALAAVNIAELADLGLADAPAVAPRRRAFTGYGSLPAGAQAALRSSRANRTSGYGRPGVKIEFHDEAARCNGCTLCVAQCPEGIIEFTPDRARGAIVHGARFDQSCKVCRECVAACPLDLFVEVPSVERPEGHLPGGA